MFGCSTIRIAGASALGVAGWLGAVAPLPAAPADQLPLAILKSPSEAPRLADAEAAEKAGRWEKALDLYLRMYVGGRTTPELREKIRVCLRNASQIRRHRDPSFQTYVLSLSPGDSLKLYAETVTKLQSMYTDRDRASPARLFALGLDELDRSLADAKFRETHLPAATEHKVQAFRQSIRETWRVRQPANCQEARHAAGELVRAAQNQAGVQNPAAVVLELLCGACSGLDEYTQYVAPGGAPVDAAIAEFAAYGILVALQDTAVVVESVIPDSWAALNTSLRRGDVLLRVNGRDIKAPSTTLLADALRTPGMGGHEIEVPSESSPLPMMVRLPVPLPSVYTAEMVGMRKEGVGYIRLGSFREQTPAEVDAAIQSLQDLGMRSLVLDLRGNCGGNFPAAVAVAQRFIPSGIVVTTQGQSTDFANRTFTSESGLTAYDMPLVVLVDGKTMSSAEIVTAALKDNGRATVVGMPTFGKGAIQSSFQLGSGSKAGTLVLTVASSFGPRGTALNGAGISPNVMEADVARQLEVAVSRALDPR